MYDIRQFRPVLFIVVLLGLVGFAIADESPGLGALGALAIGLNAWLVKSGRFIPVPRIVANVTTLMAFFYVVAKVSGATQPPLPYIGQFLFFLQIIKMYERQSNRDYVQILLLSLLLMVAASISTASLGFGIILIVYLILALYCCLLFHLKIEADRAKAALAVPEDKVAPSVLKQDQRFLSQSMRRLTGLISTVSIAAAVLVFIFFPRGSGQGLFGQYQLKPAQALTGFTEKVSFDQINRIKQNEEVVANVFLWKNGRPIEGTEPLFLRGFTLDVYGTDTSRNDRPQWTRSRQRSLPLDIPEDVFIPGTLDIDGDVWKQRIHLRPTGTRYLFSLPGPVFSSVSRDPVLALKPGRRIGVRLGLSDLSIQTDAVITPLDYEIYATNRAMPAMSLWGLVGTSSPSNPRVLDEVRRYTMGQVTGDLPADRTSILRVDESNERIAQRIERHLRTEFSYTLDLTDSRRLFAGQDPVVAFLTRVHKGHCEYFASSMTLMCQSIGIPARMVVGFRCDEYNTIAGYYTVRQAHAHTWVEVLTTRGWVTFDPTSGREAGSEERHGLWTSIRQIFDYLEYKWGQNVVAYDATDRASVVAWIEELLTSRGGTLIARLMDLHERLRQLTEQHTFWAAYLDVLLGLIGLLVMMLLAAVTWYLVQRRRLRRRAVRMGLEGLPRHLQMRLARQLAFYDHLMRVLYRNQIVRPEHLTPREFARTLVFLPTQAYEAIVRLTNVFYRVRYGQAKLDTMRQRRLELVVARVSLALDATRRATRLPQ